MPPETHKESEQSKQQPKLEFSTLQFGRAGKRIKKFTLLASVIPIAIGIAAWYFSPILALIYIIAMLVTTKLTFDYRYRVLEAEPQAARGMGLSILVFTIGLASYFIGSGISPSLSNWLQSTVLGTSLFGIILLVVLVSSISYGLIAAVGIRSTPRTVWFLTLFAIFVTLTSALDSSQLPVKTEVDQHLTDTVCQQQRDQYPANCT